MLASFNKKFLACHLLKVSQQDKLFAALVVILGRIIATLRVMLYTGPGNLNLGQEI